MKFENLEEVYRLKKLIEQKQEFIDLIQRGTKVRFTVKGYDILLTSEAKECLENEIISDLGMEINELSRKMDRLLKEE
jgi:hypothetical protein